MNTISRRRRLLAALILPFLLVLAGCRFHADFEINSPEDVTTTIDLAMPKALMQSDFSSATEMCESMRGEQPSIDDAVPEPYEEGDLWGCRVTGVADSSNYDDSFRVSEEDGKLHVVMNFGDSGITEDELALIGADSIDFRASFTFPGEVLESKGGTIDGDTVTYTDPVEFSNGVDITAEAGGGFPWWIVVVAVLLLGLLLLLALGLGAFLFMRSRKKAKSPAAVPGGYGAPAAPGSHAVPPAPGSPGVPSASGAHGSPAVPPAPQGGQSWGGAAQQSPPPAQGQQWGASPAQPGQGQPPQPPEQGQQPWSQAPGQNQPPQAPGQGQPPQNPGW
ncbi:LppM family (lipo)protein [Brachybacterium muris]|uniref:LppM family (lipo)protein n=1 Tax=Brachybacterium muris TaxID=219301 RepID=UPI00223BB354|nr:hypothetical protein [Brachybacterium muris]MCT1655137.1 hypothetical protein [Brachybacterium muris]